MTRVGAKRLTQAIQVIVHHWGVTDPAQVRRALFVLEMSCLEQTGRPLTGLEFVARRLFPVAKSAEHAAKVEQTIVRALRPEASTEVELGFFSKEQRAVINAFSKDFLETGGLAVLGSGNKHLNLWKATFNAGRGDGYPIVALTRSVRTLSMPGLITLKSVISRAGSSSCYAAS